MQVVADPEAQPAGIGEEMLDGIVDPAALHLQMLNEVHDEHMLPQRHMSIAAQRGELADMNDAVSDLVRPAQFQPVHDESIDVAGPVLVHDQLHRARRVLRLGRDRCDATPVVL
jgi:hypothetical protein